MSVVRNNIVANYVGRAWSALMSLAFIPVYIKLMGIEAYGLVGICAMLQGILAILDLGLSTTLNRELSRLSSLHEHGEMRTTVRTVETLYWAMALVAGFIVVGLSPWIAEKWIHADKMEVDTIRKAVVCMGIVLCLQLPAGLYCGGLLGLQRQVLLNTLLVILATIRSVGSVLVLWFVSPTILSFFIWQAIAGGIASMTLLVALWLVLPGASRKVLFSPVVVSRTWRFAGGITGISITSIIIGQLDKIVLSGILSLDKYAYYALASVIANVLHQLVGPIHMAVFPKLSSLVTCDRSPELVALYHKSCQLVSAIIWPAAVVMMLFPGHLLLLWTQNPEIMRNTQLLLMLLAMRAALTCQMYIPGDLQLAYGWTSLVLRTNIVLAALSVPVILLTCDLSGVEGVAAAMVIMSAAYMFVVVEKMHGRLLNAEKKDWYIKDVGIPLIVSGGSAIALRYLFVREVGISAGVVLWLLFSGVVTFVVTVFAMRETRHVFLGYCRLLYGKASRWPGASHRLS